MRTHLQLPGSATRRFRVTFVLMVVGWMIFLVSVLAFSRAQAQTVSQSDQRATYASVQAHSNGVVR